MALWRGATKEKTHCGSSTKWQRSQTDIEAQNLRAAVPLVLAFVVAGVTARSGDAPPAPPRPNPQAAALVLILREALRFCELCFDKRKRAVKRRVFFLRRESPHFFGWPGVGE